jgi:hypothetical protein
MSLHYRIRAKVAYKALLVLVTKKAVPNLAAYADGNEEA